MLRGATRIYALCRGTACCGVTRYTAVTAMDARYQVKDVGSLLAPRERVRLCVAMPYIAVDCQKHVEMLPP